VVVPARRRRRPLRAAADVGTAAFFAACGVFFWRFLRLGVLAALAYAFLFLVVHGWLFDDLFPAVTRDLASERTAFAWRLLLYAMFLVLLGGVIVVFDYARVRAVVEDRRSMVGALGAGARFVRRHLGSAAALFALNIALLRPDGGPRPPSSRRSPA
jgi:hypothetical protein